MAETKASLPKFFISADAKQAIKDNVVDADTVIKELETAGKVSNEDISKKITPLIGQVKDFTSGFLEDISKRPNEDLSSAELKQRIDIMKQLPTQTSNIQFNKPLFISHLQQQLVGNGLDAQVAQKEAEYVANYYDINKTLPEDFKRGRAGLGGGEGIPVAIERAINNGTYQIDTGGSSGYSQQIKDANALLTTKLSTEKEESRLAEQANLAESQRAKSDALFQEAVKALYQPIPTFTPELSEEVLANLQGKILQQGQTALSSVQAGAQKRGITGSSIEQFGLAQTQGNITQSLADATLNFLMKSAESGKSNREFLANSLFNAAQSYLGAGGQTEGLVSTGALSGNQLGLQKEQLAQQIQQFSQQMAESRRQYDTTLAEQQKTAAENMQLLSRYLSGGGDSKNFIGNMLSGLVGGASAGTGLGEYGGLIGGLGGLALGGIGTAAQG